MSKELKPTDKEYIEALAKEHCKKEYKGLIFEDAVTDYCQGAKDILEHTNHAELVEAAKKVFDCSTREEQSFALIHLREAIQKAEANKLKRKSCDKACSPSDWYKGGKCDKNGCYH